MIMSANLKCIVPGCLKESEHSIGYDHQGEDKSLNLCPKHYKHIALIDRGEGLNRQILIDTGRLQKLIDLVEATEWQMHEIR
jgi:hypothetical protein